MVGGELFLKLLLLLLLLRERVDALFQELLFEVGEFGFLNLLDLEEVVEGSLGRLFEEGFDIGGLEEWGVFGF